MSTQYRTTLLVFLLSIPVYIILHYYTMRFESIQLITGYAFLFFLYLCILKIAGSEDILKTALLFAVLYRILVIPGLPSLSDDFYRFFWDGKLIALGINAWQYTPAEIVARVPNSMDAGLFNLLNSPDYHSVYPPPLQGLFFAAVYLSPESIVGSTVILKLVILLAELFTILLLLKICDRCELKRSNVLIYALNPLVILELTGNIHFEALAIPFLLFAVLLYSKEKDFFSGIALGLAASLKLLPALFAPLFISHFQGKKIFYWSTGFILVSFLSLFPLLKNFDSGIGSGLNLYFQKFEFNASIYYLVREAGFWLKGYNTIATIGPWMAFATVLFIFILSYLSFKKKIQFQNSLLFALTIYLLMTTTVHPWYIIPLIAITTLTNYRFPVIWSCLIFLTYTGYSHNSFTEYSAVVFTEYFITFGFAVWEVRKYSSNWKKRIA